MPNITPTSFFGRSQRQTSQESSGREITASDTASPMLQQANQQRVGREDIPPHYQSRGISEDARTCMAHAGLAAGAVLSLVNAASIGSDENVGRSGATTAATEVLGDIAACISLGGAAGYAASEIVDYTVRGINSWRNVDDLSRQFPNLPVNYNEIASVRPRSGFEGAICPISLVSIDNISEPVAVNGTLYSYPHFRASVLSQSDHNNSSIVLPHNRDPFNASTQIERLIDINPV